MSDDLTGVVYMLVTDSDHDGTASVSVTTSMAPIVATFAAGSGG